MPGDDWDWAGGEAEPVDDFDWAQKEGGAEAPRPMEYVAPAARETSERDRFDRWSMTEQPAAEGADVGTGANVGADEIPEHYRQTGRRELVLPEIDISVDPTGERPDIVRERGQATEIREIEKDPDYVAQRRRNMRETIERERARRDASRPPDLPATPLDLPMVLDRAIDTSDVGGRDLRVAPHVRHTARLMSEAAADPRREMDASDVLNSLFPVAEASESVVGRDQRDVAGMHGLVNALSFGNADEIEDVAYGENEGDEFRQRRARAREQAPGTYQAGEVAGTLPLALIPGNQATALGRVATSGGVGFGAGFLRGAGESESEDLEGRALDALRQGGAEGLLSAGTSGIAEGAPSILSRLGGWADSLGTRAEQAAVPSRLEATGIWGGRAMREADALPGGQEALAADLRRLGIGHGVSEPGRATNPRMFPRPERSLNDADEVLDSAGERMRGVLDQMDEASSGRNAALLSNNREAAMRGMVDVSRVADDLDRVARQYDSIPIGGEDVANAIRQRLIEPLRAHGAMRFSEAHQQRRLLDDMIRAWSRDPNLATTAGQLQTARQSISRAMDDAAESLDPAVREAWRQANRDYQVGAFVRESGRGAERLSTQGGMGGANAAGNLIANNLPGGALAAPLAREAAQQQRMIWPGVRTHMLESIAPRLRRMGPRGSQWARMLDQARPRGQTAVAAIHYMLSRRDPEYRAAVQQIESQQQEQE